MQGLKNDYTFATSLHSHIRGFELLAGSEDDHDGSIHALVMTEEPDVTLRSFSAVATSFTCDDAP